MPKGKVRGRIEKNPLSQALGSYFRKERDLLRKTSNEVAIEIEIGSSFYRMIEAGSANLHPSRLLKVINAYPNSGIEFDLLCKYVVGIQMVESSLNSMEELKLTFEELMGADAEFEKLLQAFEPIWDHYTNEQQALVKKHLDSETVYIEVREFLTNKFYELEPEKRLDHELNELIDQTPSFYLEFALNTLKSLQALPVSIFFSELWRWEQIHSNDFTALHGVVLNHEGVTDYQNLERYQYKYIWGSQFQRVNLLFVEDKLSAKEVRGIFERNLHRSLSQQPEHNKHLLEEFDKIMKKVHVKTISRDDQRYKPFLEEPSNNTAYNAMWVFSLINNNNIGFLSYIHSENQQIVQGTSLRYKDTAERLEEFKQLWNMIS